MSEDKKTDAVQPKRLSPLASFMKSQGIDYTPKTSSLFGDGKPVRTGYVEIDGKVSNVRFTSRDGTPFAIFQIKTEGNEDIFVKGDIPNIEKGMDLHVEGEWIHDPRYGEQIQAIAILSKNDPMQKISDGQASMEDWVRLLSSGKYPRVGLGVARKICERFGSQIEDILTNDPQSLTEISGITPKVAEDISSVWKEERATSQIFLQLYRFGLTRSKATAIYNALGANAVSLMKKDPYVICKADGISFKTADKFALDNGLEPNSPRRIKAAIAFVLDQSIHDEGSCGISMPAVVKKCTDLIKVPMAEVIAVTDQMVQDQELIEDMDLDVVFSPKAYHTERHIARHLHRLMQGDAAAKNIPISVSDILKAEAARNIELSDSQRAAVATTLSAPVSILTGQPGTGKTTTLRVIIEMMESQKLKIALCAPSGMAAKRMSKSCGMPAMTMHRLLAYNPSDGGFTFNETNPLDHDVVVCDEFSMSDIFMANALLRAVQNGARLIFVGDYHQLPSIGPGKVLKDMIDSGYIPVAHLTELRRTNSGSAVAQAIRAINEGKIPSATDQNGDFPIYKSGMLKPEDIGNRVIDLVTRILPSQSIDIDDIQVLAPMKDGAAGVVRLNNELQRILNPNASNPERSMQVGDRIFAIGDKVINLKNNYQADLLDHNTLNPIEDERFSSPWNPQYKKGIFNGDIGKVVAVDLDKKEIHVRFDEGTVKLTRSELFNLDLAYANTVHKFQGSESSVVVMPVTKSHTRMLTRNLFYTGVSRARDKCILVTEENPSTLYTAVKTEDASVRITSLRKHLDEIYKPEQKFSKGFMSDIQEKLLIEATEKGFFKDGAMDYSKVDRTNRTVAKNTESDCCPPDFDECYLSSLSEPPPF